MTDETIDIPECQQASEQIYPLIIEYAWLDIQATPDEKTGIQRLVIKLTLNVDHEKELFNGYYKEGLVLHSHNLTWMFNEYKERIKQLQKQLDMAMECINRIASWDEGEEVTTGFDCPAHASWARQALKEIERLGGE